MYLFGGDRLASSVTLRWMVLLDAHESHRQLFGGMMALDISGRLIVPFLFVRGVSTCIVPF